MSQTVRSIRIRALSPRGFLSAGRFWPHEQQDLEVDEATFVELMKDDGNLVIVELPKAAPAVAAPVAPEPTTEKPKQKQK